MPGLPKEKFQSVTIAGAGPVGLVLACELGVRGIPVTVLEQQGEHLRHPKANNFSARTMEIFRRHDLSQTIRSQGGLPRDRATDIGYFTSMTGGWELHRVPWPSTADSENIHDPLWPTPEPVFRTTQMKVEPVLLQHARTFPSVNIRFGVGATGIKEDAEGVVVTALNSVTGETETIRSDYVVGCDGGRSTIRELLNIQLAGEGGLNQEFLGGAMQATYFRAPTLLSLFPHRDTWMHWIMSPMGRGIVVLINAAEAEFLVHFQLAPGDTAGPELFDERFAAMVGQKIPYEIISSAVWRAGLGLVAERYRKGRCFLAGDALHLFTPTGGMGVNTGIEDAFNLGWKLAHVCQGLASPQLLDSYEVERKPIGVRNTGFALSFARNAGGCPVSRHICEDGPEGEAARAETSAYLARCIDLEFVNPGLQLGARYDGSPIVIGDGAPPPPDRSDKYVPSGVPGGRLPHVWLRDGSSLYDHLGQEFTLICLARDEDVSTWRQAGRDLLGGLDVVHLPDESELGELIAARAALVRPDQHIAWRGNPSEVDAHAILSTAIGSSMPAVAAAH